MSKNDWNEFLAVVTILVLLLALAGFLKARPRSQVLAPYLVSLGVSIAIYAGMVDGAPSFHRAFILCCIVAFGIAIVLALHRPSRDRLATFAWAMLGVVTPYTVLIGLLTAACAGHSECLG